MSVEGSVHSFETFGSVDGPGVRFVIFLNGCNMRCQYCHNVDTWTMKENNTNSEDVLNKAWRYHTYWKQNGGITVSGGEPLLQIDFVLDLFKRAKKKGIHTVLDTSGNPYTTQEPFISKLKELLNYTDLILLDLKHMDEDKHRSLCGQGNHNILDFARFLDEQNKPVWIRHVLVPGINDDEEALYRLRDFVSSLHNVERFEVLPYHTLGTFKWKELGIPYALEGVLPPSKETLKKANEILQTETYHKFK